MNLVIFASDNKGLSSLNNIINEASSQNLNLFAMVCHDTQLKYPVQNKDRYEVLTNCENINPTFSQTLGVTLPFKPDWLLIQRERWEPESSIILEFKKNFNSRIGLIEPNAQILNNVETILETYSKNRYTEYIDVFFDHSEHTKNQRKVSGFNGNSVVVGNPKYDINLKIEDSIINSIKSYYKVDPNKKQVLLFSLQNTNREAIYKEYENYVKTNPQHQYFIKPYPGEPFSEKFYNDYFPKFKINNVTPILDESHIWSMLNICDIHIGCIMSILHPSLILGKQVIDLSKQIGLPSKYLDIERIIKSKNIGIEDSKDLWMRSFGFTEEKQLLDLLPKHLLRKIEKENKKVWEGENSLLYLFDSFNDSKASQRILNYIKNEK